MKKVGKTIRTKVKNELWAKTCPLRRGIGINSFIFASNLYMETSDFIHPTHALILRVVFSKNKR